MRNQYKAEFWKHEMYFDESSKGGMKKILQRKVRRMLKRLAKKEIRNESVRS
jgi:hypothetical protein